MREGGPLKPFSVLLAWVFCFIDPAFAHADLTPKQIVILVNANSGPGLRIAQHYADRRGVPRSHIVLLSVPDQETVSREQYQVHVVAPLRRALQERQLAQQVRVLLNTYGMPLRVLGLQPDERQQGWLQDAHARAFAALSRLDVLGRGLRAVAPTQESGLAADPPVPVPEHPESLRSVEATLDRAGHAFRDAAARLKQSAHRQHSGDDADALSRLAIEFGGISALIVSLKASDRPPDAHLQRLEFQASAAQRSIQALMQAPSDHNRTRAYQLVERVFGLQGLLRLASTEIEILSMRESDASLDSELSLLWWDDGLYHLAGKTPNPLYAPDPAGDRLLAAAPQPFPVPVLMVSRLDAPTPELAMRLVDRALEAETNGLEGNIYVDARGLPLETPSGFGVYDESLRRFAATMRQATSYPVVLEDTERRFSGRGEAAGTVLYAGWYRLRAYEDAFTFNPGALGYHIASGEAVSLHDATEQGWCKNALAHGITVTLGSIGEPYLDAFPLPNRFFGLLLTGRYALVEAYYLTTRYVSWRMVLVGDPLYNPWRHRAGRHDGGQEVGWDGTLPPPPSVQPLLDPVEALHDLRRQRLATLAQIERVMPGP